MKIISTKSNLLNCINIVQKAVPSKTTLPILEGILFEAKNGNLKLIATDLEMGIETSVAVDVILPGKIVISSKIIGDIVRKLPDSDVEIEVKDNTIYIKSEKTEFKINGMPADEFPELPNIKRENGLVLSQSIMREMIKQTIFAVSTDEMRQILTGVLFEASGDKVSMVALDGFRMSVSWCSAMNDTLRKAVIPSKALSEIGKILSDSEEAVNIFFSKNQILVQVGETIIITRLLEGEFINYRQLIPSEHKIKVKVNRHNLIDACERAALFAKDSKNNMIKFEITDDVMIITSNSETGDVHEELRIFKDGDDIEIAFNAKYFIDALKVIESEEIYVEFTTNVSPSIIKPCDGSGYVYLILPVRLKR